ncbi:MAG: hypothetical protein ACXACX_09215 [Candidatus Hodarchaeales archaeon]|jgi:hypothetical protein
MANKFCWSGATGANDGSKWEDAYTTVMKDWGAEAGFTPSTDFIYVRSTHNENPASALVLTGTTQPGTAPARIICVTGADTGTDPGTRTTGAQVNTNGVYDITLDEGLFIDGVRIRPGDDLYLAYSPTVNHYLSLENCILRLTGTATGDLMYLGGSFTTGGSCKTRIKDTDFYFGNNQQGFTVRGGDVRIEGGSLGTNLLALIEFNNRYACVEFVGFDLSLLTGDIHKISQVDCSADVKFRRCILNASTDFTDGGTIDRCGVTLTFEHCQVGTDSDPAYQQEVITEEGVVSIETARYRDGGATDLIRANPYSWSILTNAAGYVTPLYHGLESPPIAGRTPGDGSTEHIYRIYFASGGTQDNSKIWFELTGPNDEATNSMSVRKTCRVVPLGTPSNHSSDGVSTYTGADVGTKQYMDIAYTPDKEGPIEARIFQANPGERITVDPAIYIDP